MTNFFNNFISVSFVSLSALFASFKRSLNLSKIYNTIEDFLNTEIPKPHSFVSSPLLCMPMPGIKCPKCAAKGTESWVLQGKNCPKCGHPCSHHGGHKLPTPKPIGESAPKPIPAPKPKGPKVNKKTIVQTPIWPVTGGCGNPGIKQPISTGGCGNPGIKQPISTGGCGNPGIKQPISTGGCGKPGLKHPITTGGHLKDNFGLYFGAAIAICGLISFLWPMYLSSVYGDFGILGEILDNSSTSKTFNEISSPLDQFINRDYISLVIYILNNLRLSLTNIGLYIGIATWLSVSFNLISVNKFKVVINNWSLSLETVYATVHSIVVNQIERVKGQRYFPLVYTLFTFILASNLIGMIPYSFSTTSHFILTFSLSFTLVLGSTFLGFNLHGLKFFSLFVPSGCPLGLLPLLVIIEFISYLSRNVSLGLRLGANILSGHMLLNILAGFTYNIMTSRFAFFFLGLIPLSFIIAFSGLELGIAFIQAQVFVVLTCSYIKDALFLH